MKIGFAQINATVGDLRGNCELIIGAYERLAAAGAELVLHGHTHRSGLAKLPTPDGFAPVIGVPSASAKYEHDGRGHGQYHLYRVERDGNGWRIDVEVRGVVPTLDGFVREGQFSLAIPQ